MDKWHNLSKFVKIRKLDYHQSLLFWTISHLTFERVQAEDYIFESERRLFWIWNIWKVFLHRSILAVYWNKKYRHIAAPAQNGISWTWVFHDNALRFCREKWNIQFVRPKVKSFKAEWNIVSKLSYLVQNVYEKISSCLLMHWVIFINCVKYIIQFHYTLIMLDPREARGAL